MLFNSFIFVAFFIVIYAVYAALRNYYRAQNLLLLAASYLFYSYWDARFLMLLIGSTLVDYWVGRQLERTAGDRSRKALLAISLVSNLSILGFFKYFNFFSATAGRSLAILGLSTDPVILSVILPVGISFYTFQTLSYSIDVYRKKIPAARSLLDFALFVSFFPQLVAGPIERASTFLPQIQSPRILRADQINAGLFLILWGYFKKLVVADNLGKIVVKIFGEYTDYQGLDIVVGTLAFTLQIYGDFSGYSDIARGLAKLMGFELMVNFRLPYFAANPSDFWARWHISLSTWFRDYVYISLGGDRASRPIVYRNLAVTMLLCGLWHGAAWNFILWGSFHAALLIGYRAAEKHLSSGLGWLRQRGAPAHWLSVAAMFFWVNIGWILFRSGSIQQAVYMVTHLGFSSSPDTLELAYDLLFFSLPLLIVQVFQFRSQDLLVLTQLKSWIRVPLYGAVLASIIALSSRDLSEFIYFQF